MWGDTIVLDIIAKRCTHTNLMNKHPMTRHGRILDALGRRPDLFDAYVVPLWGRRGNQSARSFKVKPEAACR